MTAFQIITRLVLLVCAVCFVQSASAGPTEAELKKEFEAAGWEVQNVEISGGTVKMATVLLKDGTSMVYKITHSGLTFIRSNTPLGKLAYSYLKRTAYPSHGNMRIDSSSPPDWSQRLDWYRIAHKKAIQDGGFQVGDGSVFKHINAISDQSSHVVSVYTEYKTANNHNSAKSYLVFTASQFVGLGYGDVERGDAIDVEPEIVEKIMDLGQLSLGINNGERVLFAAADFDENGKDLLTVTIQKQDKTVSTRIYEVVFYNGRAVNLKLQPEEAADQVQLFEPILKSGRIAIECAALFGS
jgi:hypothetical protein